MAQLFAINASAGVVHKEQVRKHFSCHACEYNRYARVQKKVADHLIKLLVDQQLVAQKALEIGCGTGLLSRKIADHLPNMTVVHSDLAHGMSCHIQQLLPRSSVCDADAVALPFRSACFDLALSSSVYQWIDDLPKAFSEVSRILVPGGYFAAALFADQTLCELRSSHRVVIGSETSHVQSFPTRTSVLSALQRHFDVLWLNSAFEIEWHPGVPELLRDLKRIGAQNASKNKPRGLTSRRTMQRMMNHYQSQYGSARGIPATYEVIYLLGQKRTDGLFGY